MSWTAEAISKAEVPGGQNAIVGLRFTHADGRTFDRQVPTDTPATSIPAYVKSVLASLTTRDAELAALQIGPVTPPATDAALQTAREAASDLIRLKSLKDSIASLPASATVTAATNRINTRGTAILTALANYLQNNPEYQVEDLV